MVELTDAQLAAVNTINDAAGLIQLDGAEGEGTTPLGALLTLLGAQSNTPIAALGIIPPDDYMATL